MSEKVNDYISSDLYSNIVPGHSRLKIFVQITFPKNSRFVNIFQPVVVELLTIPISKRLIFDESMFMCVPPSETNVQPTHKSNFLVNYDHFFVMTPKLRYCNIWVPIHFDVFVQRLQVFLDVFRIVVDQHRWLHEADDEYFYSSFSQSAKDSIKSKFSFVDISWPFQQEIGCDHPPSNTNLLFGLH